MSEQKAEETARPRLARRLAVSGGKLAAALLIVGLVGGGVALLHMRAGLRAEPETVPPLPVAVATVAMRDSYTLEQHFAGRLEARRSTDLAFERDGLVVEVLVEEGDALETGDVVARLDIEPLQARRAQLLAEREALSARLELARLTTQRQERLSRQGNSSKQAYDEARLEAQALQSELQALDASIRQLDIDIGKSTLVAPYAGRIAARHHDEGATLTAGMAIASLAETGVPEARIGLSPAAAESLTIGERYPLETEGESVAGRLLALRPDMATGTRTVSALFRIEPAVEFLLGELVTLQVNREVRQPGFWVPLAALTAAPKGLWRVYTLDERRDGTARVAQEAVVVHHVHGSLAYVDGSLADGARVVMAGPHRVVPGQVVAPTPVVAPSPAGGDQGAAAQGAAQTADAGADLFSLPGITQPLGER